MLTTTGRRVMLLRAELAASGRPHTVACCSTRAVPLSPPSPWSGSGFRWSLHFGGTNPTCIISMRVGTNPPTLPTKRGSNLIEPVPIQLDLATKHTRRRPRRPMPVNGNQTHPNPKATSVCEWKKGKKNNSSVLRAPFLTYLFGILLSLRI
jgi:hypothetical protein